MCLKVFLKQVLGFISFILTAHVLTILNTRHQYYLNARDSAGWLVFVELVVMIYEGLAFTLRFINFNSINAFSKIAFIVVRVLSQ